MSLKQIAAQTLQLIEAGKYNVEGLTVDFSVEQASAVSGTVLYTPQQLAAIPQTPAKNQVPKIRVIGETTQLAAQKLATDTPFALLNFASARNPGGGFINGAKAQEEDLCRCSGLYPCLLTCMDYYQENRRQSSLLYTDHAIFSPAVPFFKIRGTGELLEQPFVASVITAPAPNSGPFLKNNPNGQEQLQKTFLRRWQNVLKIATDQKVKRLLLGAWGCGAFGGDPVTASTTAKAAIASHGGQLEEIVFAIPAKGRQSKANLLAFADTFDVSIDSNTEEF